MTHYSLCQDVIIWSIVITAIFVIIGSLPRR